jgi:hypothetical protein
MSAEGCPSGSAADTYIPKAALAPQSESHERMRLMRNYIESKDKRILALAIAAGVAAIIAAIVLVRKLALKKSEAPEAAEEDEYRDENGCCYTDEKNFVQQ